MLSTTLLVLVAAACANNSSDGDVASARTAVQCEIDLFAPGCPDAGTGGGFDGGMSGDGGALGDSGIGDSGIGDSGIGDGGAGDAGDADASDAGDAADADVDAPDDADAGDDAGEDADAAIDASVDAGVDAPDGGDGGCQPTPPTPPPPPSPLATAVGATTSSPVYVVKDVDDWLVQALAIVDNSNPGTSSAGTTAPNTVDITSLGCFSAKNAAAFSRAIAKRFYANLTIRKRVITPTTNPLHIRMAFAQRDGAGTLHANDDYSAVCLKDPGTFLALLEAELKALLVANLGMTAADADLWLRTNHEILMTGATPEVSIDIDWVRWGAGLLTYDNWNHSKIITNGVAALVGGSNLYEEYRRPELAPVKDMDLVVWGAAAATAREWNNTLWRDYAGRDPAVYYAVTISNAAAGPRLQLVTIPTALTTATNHTRYPFVVAAPLVVTANPLPAGPKQIVATSVPTYAGGVKGVSFTNSPNNAPNTIAVVNAYDQAIGNMLRAAITADPVEVRVSQQDFANSTALWGNPENPMSYIATGSGSCRTTSLSAPGPTSFCATIHRAALVDLLAQAVSFIPPRTVPTTVKLLKSEGAGYALKATLQDQVEGLKAVALNRSMVRNNPRGNAWTNNRIKGLRGTQFNAIVTAKGTGAQRLHTKLVTVDVGDQLGASVGSLNLYNARMMHDYGNIIVGTAKDAQQIALRAQFDTEFSGAPHTVAANARLRQTCDPYWTSQPVIANLTDPTTPFGSQVDLARGLVWSNFDIAAGPSLQIEQFGAEPFAEVAVSTDCSGNLVLSEEDGADGWNYNAAGMSRSSVAMAMPAPGTSCSLGLVAQGSVITASLSCGPKVISVSIHSLAAASAYKVTPEAATGYLGFSAGTCAP